MRRHPRLRTGYRLSILHPHGFAPEPTGSPRKFVTPLQRCVTQRLDPRQTPEYCDKESHRTLLHQKDPPGWRLPVLFRSSPVDLLLLRLVSQSPASPQRRPSASRHIPVAPGAARSLPCRTPNPEPAMTPYLLATRDIPA